MCIIVFMKPNMQSNIKKYLAQLEEEKGIQILLACETGSRAWGFPSPDSDYDVRIIYKHPKDWYLGLSEPKDTIELMLDNNEVDISGWDLRKSLRLLQKSNAPLLERIQSPIIYQADSAFLEGINELAPSCYSRIATIHHYLGMGKKAFDEVASHTEYKLKRLFYALRATMACLWILEREEIPPIEFGKMLETLHMPPGCRERVKELIAIKATVGEGYLHHGEKDLTAFMAESLARAERDGKVLPGASGSMDALNAFFLRTLNQP